MWGSSKALASLMGLVLLGILPATGVSANSNNPQAIQTTVEGIPVSYTPPPAGFNPLTATPAERATYGFPQEPANPTDQAAWLAAMQAYKNWITPSFTPMPYTLANASDHWSGYGRSEPSSSDPLTFVTGFFQAPAVVYCPTNYNASAAAWDGLGNTGQELIQAGAVTSTNGTGQACTKTGEAVYEILPSASVGVFPVNPGDQMYVQISVTPSSNTADFYIEDTTTGGADSFAVTYSSGQFSGLYAWWILERPFSGNSFGHLQHFGSDPFTSVWADDANNNQYTLSSGATAPYNIQDDACISDSDGDEGSSAVQLDSTGAVGSGGESVTVTWENTGDVDAALAGFC